MQRGPSLQMYKDARNFLTPNVESETTNALCIICCRDRELDFSTERNTRSHIITNSVLHAFGNSTRLELVNSRLIGFMDLSYKAFCKHRQDPTFRSCEDNLNILGEQSLPNFVAHFVGDNLRIPTPLNFSDRKLFHAITTIGWRILALSMDQSYTSELCEISFRCLEYIRPFVRNEMHNIDDKFAVMLHVVGQETVTEWTALVRAIVTESNRSDVEAPLLCTISPGAKSMHFTIQGTRIFCWNAVLGPLLIKYVYLDHSPDVRINVSGTLGTLLHNGFFRVPSSGEFTVPGFTDRPALPRMMLQTDTLMPLARAYAIAFRSMRYHWLQNFSNIELLVPENYGPFEEDVDTINVHVGLYRILVGNYNVWAHRLNQQVLEYRIYKVNRTMVLFAEFYNHGATKKCICACTIIRSETQKYEGIEALREAHADCLRHHSDLLLGLLRHLDPLDDLQLPIPTGQLVAHQDLTENLDEEDTFGSLFV